MKKISIKQFFETEEEVNAYKKYPSNFDINYKLINSIKSNNKVLSLGCGSGREIRLLMEKNHKIVAVDISKDMIETSKKNADVEYHLIDAVEFVKKEKRKFDYIFGLFTFFSYIKKEDRKEFIENLLGLLEDDGIIYLNFHYVKDVWKNVFKTLFVSPIMAWWYNEPYDFGDTYHGMKSGYYFIEHHYTKGMIKKMFKGFNYKLDGELITLRKKLSK